MNVFISADIEGIGGVMAQAHWDSAGADYKRACEWMTEEVNAAVRGALAAGARNILVKDSHNTGTNLLIEMLHPAAELVNGWGPLNSMVEGIDASYQAAFLIGFHARGGTVGGTLAHTWSSNLLELHINDQLIGEAGWAAAFTGHYSVPIVLVTGDDKLKSQVETELPGGFQFVQTKIGWAYNAARMRPLVKVREDIEAAARRACEQAGAVKPFKPKLPLVGKVRFRHWEGLTICANVPGVERLAFDTFQFKANDVVEAQKYFMVLQRLARPLT